MKFLPFIVASAFVCTSALAQTPVLQPVEPVVLKARMLERFELPMGTRFDLVLEQANDVQPLAIVSYDVYDHFGNVTVPRGSRLIGRYVGFQNGRHLVDWIELQMESKALRIDPPLLGTMRDGTTGYATYQPGSALGAVVRREFIVPQ